MAEANRPLSTRLAHARATRRFQRMMQARAGQPVQVQDKHLAVLLALAHMAEPYNRALGIDPKVATELLDFLATRIPEHQAAWVGTAIGHATFGDWKPEGAR